LVRTVPIFAHGEYLLKSNRKAKPFVYAQAGPALAWPNNDWKEKVGNEKVYAFEMGWLAETGFGFRFPMGKRLKWVTSLGYSFKQANYQERQFWWIGPWPSPEPSETSIEQKMNMFRAHIRLGLLW
jgi:hypothetical protein